MHESPTKQLAKYRRFRAIQKDLNHTLPDMLPKKAIKKCAKALGVYKNGSLVLGSENEMSVLMDYCVYDYRWGGYNVIERYASQVREETDSEKRILLDAMLKPRYSLFVVDDIVRGTGVKARDLLRGDSGFIMDVAWSETAFKGMVLACRIISPEGAGFSMTTGAGLPADRPIMERVSREIPERFGQTSDDIAQMSAEKEAELSACIIRIFLEGDAASAMTHEDNIAGERKGQR